MAEQELILARQYASQYSLQQKNPLRQLISRSTYQTYIGERSVESFIELFKGLVDDETGEFADHNIDIRLLYINSLKTQDVNLECLEEAKRDVDKEKINTRKANLVAMVKGVLEANILTEADCKIHLSSQLLELANVISSKVMFDRRLIRLNTAILYKQNKFNLLREDAVGYSALINDIIIGSIDLERDEFGRLPPTPLERIPHFLDIISSHIGNFHLDPNRVLDILLDFFIKEVMLNYVFWIELFKQSVWIRHLTLPPLTNDDDHNDDEDEDMGDGQQKKNYSPVMAHLLGFKFENYHVLEISDAPQELYYSGALLIMNGLIRLGDFLPYLLPDEKQLEQEKLDYLENMNKEIKSNSGGLLAQYGALGDEGTTKKTSKSAAAAAATATTTTNKENENGESTENTPPIYKANDVVKLVKALLSLGDLEHAEEILSKYNKLCDMHPTLAHYIYRLCDVILDPCYQHYVPDDLKARSTYFLECAQQSELKTVLSTGKGIVPKMPKLKTHYVLDSLKDGTHDLKKKQIYRFFYTKWSAHLEKATTYNDLLTKFLPIMRLAGYRAYLAPHLFQKLIQILLVLFERGEAAPGTVQRQVCTIMIREFLLPAISFSNCNPGLVASVWEVLDLLTFQERCQLYGEWGNDFYKKTIETKLLKARVERSVKSVMRRVSKNDVRQCGRDLGKLAHSNPTIVFSVMLDQIQSFDNLAPYMADACRYMSNFSYDVLGYFMTEKWTGSQGAGRMKKMKMKDDGIPSSWLRALSVFSGMLYKKQGIDPTPLIRYMVFRLQYDDAVADLILFNEFITKLCGIEIIGSAMTDEQITSAGCSDALRAEAFQPISNDNRRATRRVISRLKETLKKDGAALELLILLYRLNESCSAKQDISTHERVNQLNHIHQTILQYTELLTTIFDEAEYSALIPSIDVLYKEYDLPYSAVMQIIRPKTRYLLRNSMDTDTKEDEPHPVLQPIIQAVPEMIQNDGVFSLISAEFFVMFWQLSLYDIHCPTEHYEAAIKRYTDQINQCRDPRSSFCQNNRPSAVAKAERQAQANLDALKVDLPRHQQDVKKTMGMLNASHARWFNSTAERIPLIRCILQYCIYPRSLLCEVDAVYCYKFAMIMHQLNVNNYSSLTLFDFVLVESLPASMMTLTDYETTIQGRFIFKTFSKMYQWYQDEKLYTKEALGDGNGLIGFQKSWNVQTASELQKNYLLSYLDFKRVMAKWHQKSSALFEQALRSGESHQIRNAFLTLRQFIPCFPMIRDHGSAIVSATQHLASTEKRDDLKVLARSYLGLIEKSKSRWMSKNAFIGLEDPAEESQSTQISNSQANSKPSTPRPSTQRDDKSAERPSSSPSSSSQMATSSSKNNTTLSQEPNSNSSDRKKSSSKEDVPPPSSSSSSNRASSSYISSSSSSSTKKLRSDDMSSSTRREGATSDLRHSSGSSSSRHHRSSDSTSSPGRHSPRESSSRGADISTPLPSPSSQSREGVRVRDSARDAIREAARSSSSSSALPSVATTSFIGNSSRNVTSSSSSSSTKETSRDLRKSTKDDRSSTSTSQQPSSSSSRSHRDSQDPRDKRSSSSSGYTNSHSTSVSGSSSSKHKRSLEEDKEKDRDKGEKRYKTTDRPKDDRRDKDRTRDHHHDRRRTRR